MSSTSTPRSHAVARGKLPFRWVLLIASAWLMFTVVAVFYAMIPLILLPALPFLFFGVVTFVSAITHEAEKARR